MYIAGTGRLVVSLFSLFNFVNARGVQYDQGEPFVGWGNFYTEPTSYPAKDSTGHP
jgi:hypothetical protein